MPSTHDTLRLIFHTGNEGLVCVVLVLALIAAGVAGSWDYFVKAAKEEKERKEDARKNGRKSPYHDDDEPPPTMGPF